MYQSSGGMIRIRWEPCPGGSNFSPKISLQVPHREGWDIFQHCFGQNHWSSDTIVLVSSVCQLRWRFPVFFRLGSPRSSTMKGKQVEERKYIKVYIYMWYVLLVPIFCSQEVCWTKVILAVGHLTTFKHHWKISQDSIVIQFNSQPLAAKSRNPYLEHHLRTCK